MNKEKNYVGQCILFSLLIILLPACIKTYKLAPSESPQGEQHKDHRDIVNENLRSVKVYYQWETRAMFDVLWISDDTTKSYVDRYCLRRGKAQLDHDDMLQKELERNKKEIKFYMLADVRDKFHPSLSSPDAAWTIYLELSGDRKVEPESIKEVELRPEILAIFGHRFPKPKFKTAYEIVFPATDKSGVRYLDDDKPFNMVISSTNRECMLGWRGAHPVNVKRVENKCTKKRKLIKDEDYYWL